MNATQPLMTFAAAPAAVPGRSIGTILVDTGMLSAEDAESIVRLQQEQGLRFGDAAMLLGLLTEAQLQFALSRQFNYSYLPHDCEKTISEELIAAYQPFSQQAEQLRALRSQLGLRWFQGDLASQALAIVGYERGVGRSYLTANLAIAFAQLGERTLLIDADMRNPRQHQLFKLENRQGLSMLLSGRSEQEGVHGVDGFENLSVLTAGPVPPNPQELLNKPIFQLLLDGFYTNFDVVLIDTAALSTAMDAQIVAQRAGGAVVVARKNETHLAMYADLVSRLRQSGAAVVGSVFNIPPAAPRQS